METLPDDVLILIFEQLTTLTEKARAAAVCRDWRAVMYGVPQLLQSVQFSPQTRQMQDQAAQRALVAFLAVHCARVRDVDFGGFTWMSAELFDVLVTRSASTLRRLRMTRAPVAAQLETMVDCASSGFPALRELDVSYTGASVPVIGELVRLAGAHLHALLLDGFHLMDTPRLRAVADVCTLGPLTTLSLESCDRVRGDTIVHLLQTLGASLRTLRLSGCTSLQRDQVVAGVTACGQLRRLALNQVDVDDVTVNRVLEACTHLEALSLRSNAMVMMGDGAPHELRLRELDLSACERVSFGTFFLGTPLKKPPPKDFEPMHVVYLAAHPHINPPVPTFLHHAPHLHTLVLGGCWRLSDRCLHAIAQLCPQLRRIEMSLCASLSNSALWALGAHCPELRVCILTRSHVDNKGIEQLVRGCGKLHTLSLGRSKNVDTRCCELIGSHLRWLRALDLNSCSKVGDEGIGAVLRGCPRLEQCDVTATAIGAAGLALIEAHGMHPTQSGRVFVRTLNETVVDELSTSPFYLSVVEHVDGLR